MKVGGRPYRAVWMEGSTVHLINQPLLPHRFDIYRSDDHRQTADAIRAMIVRGAPAIGATAAYGLVQAFLEAPDDASRDGFLKESFDRLQATRPTAQNLFYALDRVWSAAMRAAPARQADAARAEADALAEEDVEACRRIGEHGAPLIEPGATVLTHCNAGWLACVDWGTALSPIYRAHHEGRTPKVFADETRPRCQGANLTAWELMQEGVPVEVIADNAAGYFMRRGEVTLAITGADRIAANGDVVNKIGTYEKALLAREHGVPFYVAAPSSTFDLNCPHGDAVPIEERDKDEVHCVVGWTDAGESARVRVTPQGAAARNPAFDVTPAGLIAGLITEHGIIEPTADAIAAAIRPTPVRTP